MRQVDQPERPRPLGNPIRQPAPQRPEWRQVDGARKGIEQGPDGKLRNNAPTPPPKWALFDPFAGAVYFWNGSEIIDENGNVVS